MGRKKLYEEEILLRLDSDLKRTLEKMATQNKMTRADFIRYALFDYCHINNNPSLLEAPSSSPEIGYCENCGEGPVPIAFNTCKPCFDGE